MKRPAAAAADDPAYAVAAPDPAYAALDSILFGRSGPSGAKRQRTTALKRPASNTSSSKQMKRAYQVATFGEEKTILLAKARRMGEVQSDKKITAESFAFGLEVSRQMDLASRQVRTDREIASAFMKVNGMYLDCFSEALRNDEALVLEGMASTGGTLRSASAALRSNKDFVIRAMKVDGSGLMYADDRLRNDRDVVLAAVRQDGQSLEDASAALRADRGVVLEAMKRSGEALKWAANNLQGDKDIVLEAVKSSGYALEFASKEARADREVVLAAVRNTGYALEFASKALRGDAELVLEAVKSEPHALQEATVKLKQDKDFMLRAFRCGRTKKHAAACYEWVHPDLQDDFGREEFVGAAASGIAVPGDPAPVVTVNLTSDDPAGGPHFGFDCEATLLSGSSFTFSLTQRPALRMKTKQRKSPGLRLADLAQRLLVELPRQTQIADAKHVYINFLTEAEDPIAVTPWDWSRALQDFVKWKAK